MICASRDAALWAVGEAVLDSREVHAALTLAPHAFGLTAMFYASGDSRRAAVQQAIAKSLKKLGVGTCVAELLDPAEAEDQRATDDVSLLADRMHATLDILASRSDTRRLPLALLAAGASVPAAVAVASQRAGQIDAVVACYGRPDLAPVDLASISVPTLLVVPSKDSRLVERNERVFERLNCPSQLAVIVGASREFSEPGTLVACDYVVQQWCERHLRSAARSPNARCG
jgi:putative phosphoribosyl transferase